MAPDFDTAARQIVEAGRWLAGCGWAPAGAGNYSVRLGDGSVAITVSGRHKGRIGLDDVMRVDLDGRSLDGKTPSAETLLHMLAYRMEPRTGAVLHTHSLPVTVLTRHLPGGALHLDGYEVMKAFGGVQTHQARVALPVFDNDQDMTALSLRIEASLASAPAYLIRGHGLYGWGADMEAASCVVEAAEFLVACELELLKLNGAGP
jgi:methylthioribulose-1-phosphate dehydratase